MKNTIYREERKGKEIQKWPWYNPTNRVIGSTVLGHVDNKIRPQVHL